jgi:hypothetical protein
MMRKRLRRSQVLTFFAGIPPCLVGLEACATAHHWARELIALGHEARLMPPNYVKAYVKRNKHDVADAEAICEAVRRPSMRFVPVKTVEQQSARPARSAGHGCRHPQPNPAPTSSRQRIFTDLPAKAVSLEVVIETRDRSHREATIASLRAANVDVDVGGH